MVFAQSVASLLKRLSRGLHRFEYRLTIIAQSIVSKSQDDPEVFDGFAYNFTVAAQTVACVF